MIVMLRYGLSLEGPTVLVFGLKFGFREVEGIRLQGLQVQEWPFRRHCHHEFDLVSPPFLQLPGPGRSLWSAGLEASKLQISQQSCMKEKTPPPPGNHRFQDAFEVLATILNTMLLYSFLGKSNAGDLRVGTIKGLLCDNCLEKMQTTYRKVPNWPAKVGDHKPRAVSGGWAKVCFRPQPRLSAIQKPSTPCHRKANTELAQGEAGCALECRGCRLRHRLGQTKISASAVGQRLSDVLVQRSSLPACRKSLRCHGEFHQLASEPCTAYHKPKISPKPQAATATASRSICARARPGVTGVRGKRESRSAAWEFQAC